ncbi:MAG: cytochrome c biogenesis protein CcsA [Phycisphaeraceae bacterium]|nr:MAG: cytochrome c biogenesis protein CcsA [Phycisphaeraceae bacterium]
MNMTRLLHVARSAVALALLWTTAASAQPSPAGNEHPAETPVTPSAHAAPPVHDHGERVSPARKIEFMRAIDLEPLRDLSVFHNGRVKILDTLARESVKTITGASKYVEYVESGSSGGKTRYEKVKFDPLFTLLDIIVDPGYYADKPVIGVEFLPMRERIIELEFPGDEAAKKRYTRLLRVSPEMIRRHAARLDREAVGDARLERSMGDIQSAMGLLAQSGSNLLLVAPPTTDAEWPHILSLVDFAKPPAQRSASADPRERAINAFVDLMVGWSDLDAPKVNAAAREFAASIPLVNPEVYPQGRRTLELSYNRAGAFEWGFVAYFISLVALLVAFGTGRGWVAWAGAGFLVVAIGMHAFGFLARCVIAERWAIQNQFESMTGLSLFASVVGLGMMAWKRQWLFGAATAGAGFLVLVAATQLDLPGKSIGREAAILNTSVLLKYHVTTVLVSYGLITLGFIVSLFYLGAHYLRRGDTTPAPGESDVFTAALGTPAAGTKARLLADLDTAQMTVLQLAFWTLGVGILLGAWWADHSWGRWWAFDPKETWALITWIIYLITIHVRLGIAGNKGLVTAWLSAVGFFVMLWTYFGVNLLLPGLHAYA